MQERQLFEYAVIRVVPRVEREEFVNVGVILFCARLKFLKTVYMLNQQKIMILCAKADCHEIEDHLRMFEQISNGNKEGGPIALLDQAGRFRWLTATRSTVLQTSKVHPGLCVEPDDTLNRLFQQLVL
jgi:hypothetical protein